MLMNWKNIVKISVPLKATYRVNHRQDSNGIFTEEEKNPKIHMKLQKTHLAI